MLTRRDKPNPWTRLKTMLPKRYRHRSVKNIRKYKEYSKRRGFRFFFRRKK